MNRETRVAIINKEIATYQKYIDIIPQLMSVIKKWNGKCINKNFEADLNAAVNTSEKRFGYVSVDYGYEGRIEISVNVDDRHISEIGSDKQYPTNYYISNDSHTLFFKKELFEITAGGKYRIIADKMQDKFAEDAINLGNKITKYKAELGRVDTMIAEAKQLEELVSAFRSKYDYHFLEKFGVNYNLKDNTSFEYKRYSHEQ